ncbi:MAG: cellulose biosynthesis cyclic di-GMP-binding regulatory protein BcsB [Rhizobium sp.]|nr:cellulose biosynthesis cyclic di-GMP-binding regulatory protein BcsB [Rhizobium sp.]
MISQHLSYLAAAGLLLAASSSLAATSTGFILAPQVKVQTEEKSYFQDESQIRRLIADKQDLFFTGENASREYAFVVLPSEMTGSAKLILTLQTAISVAPERSAMRIFVNDRDVGSVNLKSGDPHQVELELPKGLLQPGYNAVTVLMDQSHRVDCSVEATYELWTQIDPARSGFVFTRNAKDDPSDVSTLLAYSRDVNGHAAINGLIPRGATGEDIDRTFAVVQALSIFGHFDRPVVTMGNNIGSGPGIDLVVGTFGTVRDLIGVVPDGAGVQFDIDPASGRSRMIVAARTADELASTIQDFTLRAQTDITDGSPQGRRALGNRRGRLLESGSSNTLAELGFVSRPFAGRHFQQAIAFSLPADFYPGDYGAANLKLHAEYAAGLSPMAQMVVRANGDTVASIRLGEARSGRIDGQVLPIPLDKLRPGYNVIEFEAELHAASDAVCDPSTLGNTTARLFIKGDSTLNIPAFAQIGHAPDLAVVSAGRTGFGGDATMPLHLENMDETLLGAAGTFLAKMAYASREVSPVSVTSGWPLDRRGPLLAFGTFSGLSGQLRSDLGIDVNPVGGDLTLSLDPNTRDPAGAPVEQAAPALSVDGSPVSEPEQGSTSIVVRLQEGGRKLYEGLATRVRIQAAQLGLVEDENVLSTDAVYQVSAEADMLVAQRLVNDRDAWTVVAVRDPALLAEGMRSLVQTEVWGRLGGSVYALKRDGGFVERKMAAQERLYETKPLSLQNGRLIVAGWFSNNAREFTIAQIVVAILLGAATFVVLRQGRRS